MIRPRWLPILFVIPFVVGLGVFRDFGVSTDEVNNQRFGEAWGHRIAKMIARRKIDRIVDEARWDVPSHRFSHNLSHGPLWELTLFAVSRALYGDNASERGVLMCRHLVNFLLFMVAVCIFYLLVRKLFESEWWGMLAATLLLLVPRIFAHAFYNSVDIGLLSFFIFCLYTFDRLVRAPTVANALLHAASSAVAIDVRLAAGIVPACTLIFFATRPHEWRRSIRVAGIYVAACTLFVLIGWPFLWRDTLHHLHAVISAGLFNNADDGALDSPYPSFSALYTADWMARTLPLAHLVAFFVGVAALAIDARRYRDRTGYIPAAAAFGVLIAVLVATAVAHTSLSNDWRHHYFLAPLVIIVAVYGIRFACRWRASRMAVAATTTVGLMLVLRFMIVSHPFQFTYVNELVRMGNDDFIEHSAADEWGVSHRRALEEILAATPLSRANVWIRYYPHYTWHNQDILPPVERARLIRAPNEMIADYVIAMRREGAAPPFRVIRADGIPIAFIYERTR